jgi:hypothetical protein
MRTLTLLVLLLSIKIVNGQQVQFNCYELIEKKKGNFEKYLKKIPLLPSGFVYKEWMPLDEYNPILSKEYIEFNMASFDDIRRNEMGSLLYDRYVLGYIKNNDNTFSILTIFLEDSIQDSLKGRLVTSVEILLYNNTGDKIAQYKPKSYPNFSFCIENNNINVDFTITENSYLDENFNVIEEKISYQFKYQITASAKGINIIEPNGINILIKSTNQENYKHDGIVKYSNGTEFEGQFNISDFNINGIPKITADIENSAGKLTHSDGTILSGVFCDTLLCNYPDIKIDNLLIEQNDTLSKDFLIRASGFKLTNNPNQFKIHYYVLFCHSDNKTFMIIGIGSLLENKLRIELLKSKRIMSIDLYLYLVCNENGNQEYRQVPAKRIFAL